MTEAALPSEEGLHFSETRGRWVLLATILGSAVAGLDATVVNLALPAIGKDFNAGVSTLQWILTAYLLTLAALILVGGSLGDRFGRRKVFLIGVVWFALASALCGLAPNASFLILARGLQGVGGALLTPGSLAIIQASFVPEDRARAIGAWSAFAGIATAVGPLVGGYLVDAVSWRAVFLLNLPLAVVVVIVSRRYVPESSDPGASHTIDYAGAILAVIGLAGVTYALVEASGSATPALDAVIGAIGLLALVGFVLVEMRSREPMVPLDVFRSRQFTSANLVTLVVYAALGGMLFLLGVYLQTALHYSPIEAGLALLPVTILMLALSARSGAIATRIGPRIQMSVGPIIIAAGLLLMARIEPGQRYVTTALPAVIVFGLGLATTVAPLTSTVLAAASMRHSGVASGINNAVARSAQLLAVAILPVVAGITGGAYRDPSKFVGGFRTAAFITAGLAAAGGILAWFTIRNDVLQTPDGELADPIGRDGDDGGDVAGRLADPDERGRTAPDISRAHAADGSSHYFCGVDSPDTGHHDSAPTN
ncbi:MAG: drug resistance transporter, EmrB/QacA subfamily [Actinomycetia bacterium]|nr:drug resistance transporter, EmrB/QacA subfamily [Actinomycetes bacterium]